MNQDSKNDFVAQVAKKSSLTDSTAINEDGKFFVKIDLTYEEVVFIMLHFDSQEEFKEAYINEVTKLKNK